ncbi:MAG: hypothetical protein HY593_01310 [Candidatus Omnitrophica bacterium]|nr:hypothetical protein [Candidatus Omnitrophota bacterium]
MNLISERKIEFISKTITDLGKAMFAVGVASYFFERFPFAWRIVMGGLMEA